MILHFFCWRLHRFSGVMHFFEWQIGKVNECDWDRKPYSPWAHNVQIDTTHTHLHCMLRHSMHSIQTLFAQQISLIARMEKMDMLTESLIAFSYTGQTRPNEEYLSIIFHIPRVKRMTVFIMCVWFVLFCFLFFFGFSFHCLATKIKVRNNAKNEKCNRGKKVEMTIV